MRRALLGAAVELFIGAAWGMVVAYLFHRLEPPAADWTTYPTLSGALQGQPGVVADRLRLHDRLFSGCLLGGGFGAVAGVVAGATGAVIKALGGSRSAI